MTYSNMENADMDIEGRNDPWSSFEPKPVPYKVRRIRTDRGEHDLNMTLEGLLNEMAKEHYHPIRFHNHDRTDYTYAYTVIFYYMPNGPAFTPPF